MKPKLIFFLFLFTHTLHCFEPIILLIGPSGSGKGSCSQFFKENFGYEHISIGDLIRDEIEKKTETGRRIAEAAGPGEVRTDKSIVQNIMLKSILAAHSKKKPFIIDGYGREKEDVTFLYNLLGSMNLLERVFVLFLKSDASSCKERISNRLVCIHCHHVYNKITAPAQSMNTCDTCFHPLKCRIDDSPEIIEKRMMKYINDGENNLLSTLELYPYFTYGTDRPLEECFQFYANLHEMMSEYPGNSREFVHYLKSILGL